MDSVQNMQCCSNKMIAYFVINKQKKRQTYKRVHQQDLFERSSDIIVLLDPLVLI